MLMVYSSYLSLNELFKKCKQTRFLFFCTYLLSREIYIKMEQKL